MMTAFIATFANGTTITRNSDHKYSFAWAVFTAEGAIKKSGFSADRANAARAADAILPRPVSDKNRKNQSLMKYWAKMARDRGFANVDAMIQHWDEEAAASRAALRIEIVPAQFA